MATIKLQASGAVVLKNGKVSCGCCAQTGCCMYPAQAFGEGQISIDDLPDELLFYHFGGEEQGVVFNKGGNGVYIAASGGLSNGAIYCVEYSSLYYYNTPPDFPAYDGFHWIFAINGNNLGPPYNIEDMGPCLISPVLLKDVPLPHSYENLKYAYDQFADSYTVTPNIGDSASPTVVTRISLCVWRGSDTCGNFVYLSYGSNPNGGQDIMWNVFFRFYTPICVIDGQVDGQKNDDEFENTPVGTYSGTFEDSAFVS
jgi:hypothetical protein